LRDSHQVSKSVPAPIRIHSRGVRALTALMAKLIALVVLSALGVASAARGQGRAARYARGRNLLQLRGASMKHGAGQRTPEQLEAWKDSGKAIRSKLSDDILFDLASGVTTEVYGKQLHELVDDHASRFVTEKGNARTADYIKEQFKDMGLMVSEQAIVRDPRILQQYSRLAASDPDVQRNQKAHTNVIGFLKGGDLAHEVVLLGAHYDSVNWEDAGGSAPGVDDNGSGSALMLAVARTLTGAGEKFQPRRSLMFVAFNAEEEGLVGSEHFAKMFKKEGPFVRKYGDLKAAFVADEVAWPGRGSHKREAILETHGHGEGTTAMVDTLATLALLKNKTSSVPGDGIGNGLGNGFVVNYNGFGSDHMSFLKEGIPSVLLIERDDDYHAKKWGHSARDTFDHVDMSYGASMTRLALRAVASFASPV